MTRKTKKIICTWFWGVMVIVIAALLFSINGNQQNIMVMQTAAMDKLNEISVEVDPEEEEAPADPVATYQLTPEEFALICRVVMSESGDQGLQAQMAVAQTIYDRMNDWGDSIDEAICPGVYSTKDNGDPTDSVKLAVANVFEGGMRIYEGGTYQFHDDTVLPHWTEGKIARGSIGNLRFYGGYAQ